MIDHAVVSLCLELFSLVVCITACESNGRMLQVFKAETPCKVYLVMAGLVTVFVEDIVFCRMAGCSMLKLSII